MPWISIHSADKLIFSQANSLSENKIIRAESFKGDRWVEIQKGDTYYIIVEHGYSNAEYKVDKKDLKSIIKRLIDREFPRSHQIRIKNYSKKKD